MAKPSWSFQIKHSFWVLLFFANSSWAEKLPENAQRELDKIPGKSLSLDFVLAKAIESSNSFKQVVSGLPSAQAASLQAQAPYDWTIVGSGGYLDSENESDSPFSPESVQSLTYEVGLTKAFSQSGTSLALKLNQGNSSSLFGPGFAVSPNPLDSNQTQFQLDVKQSLIKNSFGTMSRKNVLAGELETKSQSLKVMQSAEDWTLSMVDLFYSAWLSKAQYESAEKILARQQKLVNLIQLQFKRGTATRSDVIQVQNSLQTAKNRVIETKQSLQETWNFLILNLKLPKDWQKISANLIPLSLDAPIPEAKKYCDAGRPSGKVAAIQSAEYAAEAASLRLEAAKSSAMPELNLALTAKFNGIDEQSKAETMSEVFSAKHPSYFVGLEFKVPLGSAGDKATLYREVSNQRMLSASADQAVTDVEVQLINQCLRLNALINTLEKNIEIAKTQETRATLEQKRFENGRINLLQVNSAEQDAVSAEVTAQNNQIQLRLAAWQIFRASGALANRLSSKLQIKN